ncbi:MAG: hypothetical protein R2827_15525 [Bdellovibrionales bacterium]
MPKKLPYLSVDEVISLLDLETGLSNREPNALRDQVTILLMYGAGLRVSEAVTLR